MNPSLRSSRDTGWSGGSAARCPTRRILSKHGISPSQINEARAGDSTEFLQVRSWSLRRTKGLQVLGVTEWPAAANHLYTAARECFSDGLKSRKRGPAVRHRAWWERSKCYASEGQRARARADLERILSEDSGYPGVAEALDDLS